MSPEVATIIVAIITVVGGSGTVYLGHILNKVKKQVEKSGRDNKDLHDWWKKKKQRIITIFILDNDPQDLELVERRLVKAGHKVESFLDVTELKESLTDHESILIIDYYLTKQTAVEVVRDYKKRNYNNYSIVLSGHKSESMLFSLTNAGIDKFVYKNDPDYLEQIEMYVNEAIEIISNL